MTPRALSSTDLSGHPLSGHCLRPVPAGHRRPHLVPGHERGHPSPRVRTVSVRGCPHPLEVPMSQSTTTAGRPSAGPFSLPVERA
jgi:hypothetical protein